MGPKSIEYLVLDITPTSHVIKLVSSGKEVKGVHLPYPQSQAAAKLISICSDCLPMVYPVHCATTLPLQPYHQHFEGTPRLRLIYNVAH